MEEKKENIENKHDDVQQSGSLRERLARVKPTRWVRFAIVAAIFIGWVVWLGSWWVILFLPLLADIYLTQFIPWSWWKHTKNKAVKAVMGWVDAIVYALVLVYFIFLFFGQNYQIPSSSLEKSLLVGDYLWVNKMVYGPRVPNTPIHFPLAQNTLPILNCKSYVDWPQWEYHRLKGFRNVERFDIVVFNFPAGDTVALKVQNPDYYTLCSFEPGGAAAVRSNKAKYGDVIYRPVDRRENYVKRCIGLPGERLQIKDNIVYINGKAIAEPENVQYNYLIQTDGREIDNATWEELGVSVDDRSRIAISEPGETYGVMSLGLTVTNDGTVPPIYQVPLTKKMLEQVNALGWITHAIRVPVGEMVNVYPITHDYGWTRADYGEIWIPKKGATI
ncbi:MAG: S26 family signal peptidase, partial [Muribaculaceae bacterium]